MYILKKYSNLITEEDHQKRLNRLIWDRTWGSAKRQLDRVNKDYKKLSFARIRLARRKSGVDNAVARVPEHLKKNEGLIFERIRWRRKAGLRDESFKLLLSYQGNFTRPDRWWTEIRYHIRYQLSNKNYENALKLVKNHKQMNNANISEAEWLAGWISLQFTKNSQAAYEHFTKMFNHVSTPISTARAAYWSGRAAETIGDNYSANNWFERAAALPTTFYGQLALRKVNKELFLPNPTKEFIKNELNNYTQKTIVKALIALIDVNHKSLSRLFALHLTKEAKNSKEVLILAKILESLNKYPLSIMVGKRAVYQNIYIPSLNFPLPKSEIFSEKHRDKRISLPITLAISRQESAFDTSAKSRAGALGIMQIMPRT